MAHPWRAVSLAVVLLSQLAVIAAEYRSYDGRGNNLKYPVAGAAGTPFLQGSAALFTSTGDMIPSPDLFNASTSCVAPLPAGNWPMGRCVSDLLMSYATNLTDTKARQMFTSSTLRTHMITHFAHWISFDLTASSGRMPVKIAMPTDDALYQSPGTTSLAEPITFYLTERVPNNVTEDLSKQAPVRTGLNGVTSYLDGSMLYGSSVAEVTHLREPQGCRMRTRVDNDGNTFPLWNVAEGHDDVGFFSKRSGDVFKSMFSTLFLREHNRHCDQLKADHADMDDNTAFEETRAYIIALLQHITVTEYLANVLGTTLPPYTGYKPDLLPGIDTLWASSTFRQVVYGHTELGDFYPILDRHDQLVHIMTFQESRDSLNIEDYGFENLVRVCARQSQEEVDIYYSDKSRNYRAKSKDPMDLAQTDVLRGRDRGLPLYNDARRHFNLPPAKDWSDISSVPRIQNNLKRVYGSVDRVEFTTGALSEDHVPSSSLGLLYWHSMMDQFSRIRDMDRFWYQNKGVLDPQVLTTVQTTNLRTLFLRHFRDNSTLPANIWVYERKDTQPAPSSSQTAVFSSEFSMSWSLSPGSIEFTLTFKGPVGWFGIGLGPNPHMGGAQFFIVEHESQDSNTLVLSRYRSAGPAVQPTLERVIAKGIAPSTDNKPLVIKFSRTLDEEDGVSIPNSEIYVLHAYSTSNKKLSYHQAGDKHGSNKVNFFSRSISGDLSNLPRVTHKWHGIGMFISWGIIFPVSIFIVRYQKHRFGNAMSIHRHIQILTGFSIATLASAAIATATPGLFLAHKVIGVTILVAVIGQIGLGLISVYTLGQLESANKGFPRAFKWAHRALGSSVLLVAWVNIYFGLVAYNAPLSIIYAYFAYLGALVLFVLVYHYRWHKSGYTVKGTRRIMVQDFLNRDDEKHGLSKNSMDDKKPLLSSWAKLVVVDSFVFDIREWISSHPGGAKVLERVIGTDITTDFYGHASVMGAKAATRGDTTELQEFCSTRSRPTSQASSDSVQLIGLHEVVGQLRPYKKASNLPKVLAMFDENSHNPPDARRQSYNRRSFFLPQSEFPILPVEKKSLFDRIIDKVMGLSNYLDRLNIRMVEGNGEGRQMARALPSHAHSARAIQRLARYCIGVVDSNETSPQALRRRSSVNVDPSRMIFKRYILTSKTTLSSDIAARPVRRFTFRPSLKDPVLRQKASKFFMPGEYIEIQCRVDDQISTRSYTPIEGSIDDEFAIYVKIYSDGLVSKFLDKQFPGYEIRIRGPFEHAEQSGGYASISGGLMTRSVLFSSRPDGCWGTLLMIAGGTGLSPMLQLIQHHIRHQSEDPSFRCQLFLLFVNRTHRDVFAGQQLDELVELSEGRLTIDYGINEAGGDTPGVFRGHLSHQLLKGWFTRVSNIQSGLVAAGSGQDLSRMSGEHISAVQEDDFMLQTLMRGFVRPNVRVVVSGPAGMMDMALEFLENCSFPADRIVAMH
ncbi:hypothetical protein BGZ75_009494 [Mortierella antarctica]|nr:hypothetical protein BGZ75_009494 [Mortierella antarctica]